MVSAPGVRLVKSKILSLTGLSLRTSLGVPPFGRYHSPTTRPPIHIIKFIVCLISFFYTDILYKMQEKNKKKFKIFCRPEKFFISDRRLCLYKSLWLPSGSTYRAWSSARICWSLLLRWWVCNILTNTVKTLSW